MKVILLCSLLLLVGCKEIAYYEPQPKGVTSLKEVPLSLQGRYRIPEEDGVRADTVTISANGYTMVKHEDHTILGDSIILKYYKRHYYYNILAEDGSWLLRLITVDQNGDLSIWSMKQPHDDYRELIKTLSKEVKVDSTVTDLKKIYRIDPTPKQMNRLIKKGLFTRDGTLKKIE